MMKLVESIVISQTMFEYYLMRSNFQKFINLVNLMKMSFSTIDANIVRSCKKEEKVWFLTFLVLTSAAFSLSVAEPFIVNSEEWNQKRARFYSYKHPENIVPINFYTPGGFIDLSSPPFYYIYMMLMPYFACDIILVSGLVYTSLGIFSIHIKGQYQVLHRYIKMVQKNMRPVVISTCFCFISLVALSAQIMLKSQYKLAYSFCFILLILHVVKLAEFSNGIETCNRQIPSMLYFDSDWYTKSKSMKNMVSFIIRRSQKSEHYAFFGGFVTFHRPLLLSLMSKTYTFINWLIYMNRH
ncbi:hypothetical protein M8J75_016484 [Diaphorina citri]|nr:hypothetical protein M8J75_016484 [Diaphorina citri]